jgi:hypothetical protein
VEDLAHGLFGFVLPHPSKDTGLRKVPRNRSHRTEQLMGAWSDMSLIAINEK